MKNYRFGLITPYLVCFAACLFSFFNLFQFSLFNTISAELLRDLSLSSAKLGLLSGIYLAANALWLLPGGLLLDRFSVRKIALSFMALVFISCYLIAQSHSFFVIGFARLCQGTASGMSLLILARLTSLWFPHAKATAIGIAASLALAGGMFGNIGFMIIVNQRGWRAAMIIAALIGLVIFFFMCIFLIEKSQASKFILQKNKTSLSILQPLKYIFAKKYIIYIGLYVGLMNLPLFIFASLWGNLFLTQVHGLTTFAASSISSLLYMGTMTGLPIAGYFSDKTHNRQYPLVIGAVGAFLILLLIIFNAHQTSDKLGIEFFLLGFFSSAQIICFAIAADQYALNLRSTASSIIALTENAIGAIAQPLFGLMLNYHWGEKFLNHIPLYTYTNYQFALLILVAGILSCIALSLFIQPPRSY